MHKLLLFALEWLYNEGEKDQLEGQCTDLVSEKLEELG